MNSKLFMMNCASAGEAILVHASLVSHLSFRAVYLNNEYANCLILVVKMFAAPISSLYRACVSSSESYTDIILQSIV